MADLCGLAEQARDWLGRAGGLAGEIGLQELWEHVERRMEVEALAAGQPFSEIERALVSHLLGVADAQAVQASEIAEALRRLYCDRRLELHYQVEPPSVPEE